MVEVVEEVLVRIDRNLHPAKSFLRDLREKFPQFLPTGMYKAESHMGKLRIATGFVLGRLLDHHHGAGAGALCSSRRLHRGTAAAHNDDITSLLAIRGR